MVIVVPSATAKLISLASPFSVPFTTNEWLTVSTETTSPLNVGSTRVAGAAAAPADAPTRSPSEATPAMIFDMFHYLLLLLTRNLSTSWLGAEGFSDILQKTLDGGDPA